MNPNKIVGWNMYETIEYINPNPFKHVRQALYDMIVATQDNPQKFHNILLYATASSTYATLIREILTEHYPQHLPLLDKILLLQ